MTLMYIKTLPKHEIFIFSANFEDRNKFQLQLTR